MMRTISLQDVPNADGTPVVHEFQFPDSWEDANTEHLHAVCRAQSTDKTETSKRFTLLRELAGIPGVLMGRMPPLDQFMQYVDVTDHHTGFKPVEKFEWQLLPQLDWCFKPPVYRNSLLPSFKHNEVEWHGPDDGFDRMSLDQWIWCTTLLKTMREAPDEEKEPALNNFLAAVYAPRPEGKPAYDPITKAFHFDDDGIEHRAILLADLPVMMKIAATLNYEAIHATLPNLYWRVFDPEGEVQNSPQGLFGLAYDVASSAVFGKIQESGTNRLHAVLGYMEHNIHKDMVAEEKAKQDRKVKH